MNSNDECAEIVFNNRHVDKASTTFSWVAEGRSMHKFRRKWHSFSAKVFILFLETDFAIEKQVRLSSKPFRRNHLGSELHNCCGIIFPIDLMKHRLLSGYHQKEKRYETIIRPPKAVKHFFSVGGSRHIKSTVSLEARGGNQTTRYN